MIPGSLDRIVTAFFPKTKTRLTLANVTDTARALERNHLCGPTAGLIQAELVGGVVLLGSTLKHPEQVISLRLKLPGGCLGGASIECTAAYTVRGYTFQKVIAELDDSDCVNEELFLKALGKTAQCGVVICEGTKSSNSLFNVSSETHVNVSEIIETYFDKSLGRDVLVQISGATEKGYVACVHTMMCEFMEDAKDEDLETIEERFDSPEVCRLLNEGADLQTVANALNLGEVTAIEDHSVCFACSCSSARVMAMLSSLPKTDLEAMVAEQKPHDIFCHMCGKGYTITPEQLRSLL